MNIKSFNDFLTAGALIVLTIHAILLHWRVARLWRAHLYQFGKVSFDDEEE